MPTWIHVPHDSPFTEDTLPYGIFSREGEAPRAGVAIGDTVVDLAELAKEGLFDRIVTDPLAMFAAPTLDRFAGAGPDVWHAIRARIKALISVGNEELHGDSILYRSALSDRNAVLLHRPMGVGDYVDFFSSLEHATNAGKIFRPDTDAPLTPNYRSLPIGYHGRSSTVVLSETPVTRPHGQSLPPGATAPAFGPSAALDFELELGFVTGPGNALGSPIPIANARDHIFGCVLLNDWSARDLQAWETVPLGPFLGKSFATSISPWIVPLEALEPFRVPSRAQEPPPFPYLQTTEPWGFDIALDVTLQSERMRAEGLAPVTIVRTSFAGMYWSMAQQLAHATINGTQIRPGDLYGSGTISGPDPGSFGSMLELTWRGANPLTLPSGETRAFLEDGDTVVMSARCEKDALRVGFGEVRGTISPAR
jgi:fumarylacetoacetase